MDPGDCSPDLDPRPDETPAGPPARGRRWLGIHFECCHVYSRVYKNAAGTAYEGRCPRCYARLVIPVGPGGSTARFFSAS